MCRYIIRHLEEIHHMVNMCRYDLRHLEEVHHMVNMCRYDIRHLEEVHELLTVSPKKTFSRGLRYFGMILLYFWVRFSHFPPFGRFFS